MKTSSQDPQSRRTTGYLIEVRGRVGPVAAGWLDARPMAFRDDCTLLEVQVVDQSELHGRLRRIHDLNLTLVSLRRTTDTHDDGS